MGKARACGTLAWVMLLCATASAAGDGAPPPPASVEKGREAYVELRCGGCHDAGVGAPRPASAPHAVTDSSAAAPALEIAGSKYRTEWLSALFGDRPDLVAYLASRMDDQRLSGAAGVGLEAGDTTDAAEGRRLYASFGCMACHRIGGEGEAIGPRLDDAGRRLRTEYIVAILLDPQAVRPGAEMPDFDIDDASIRRIATYLGSLGRP